MALRMEIPIGDSDIFQLSSRFQFNTRRPARAAGETTTGGTHGQTDADRNASLGTRVRSWRLGQSGICRRRVRRARVLRVLRHDCAAGRQCAQLRIRRPFRNRDAAVPQRRLARPYHRRCGDPRFARQRGATPPQKPRPPCLGALWLNALPTACSTGRPDRCRHRARRGRRSRPRRGRHRLVRRNPAARRCRSAPGPRCRRPGATARR